MCDAWLVNTISQGGKLGRSHIYYVGVPHCFWCRSKVIWGQQESNCENLVNNISQEGKLWQISYLVCRWTTLSTITLLLLVEVKGHLGSTWIKLWTCKLDMLRLASFEFIMLMYSQLVQWAYQVRRKQLVLNSYVWFCHFMHYIDVWVLFVWHIRLIFLCVVACVCMIQMKMKSKTHEDNEFPLLLIEKVKSETACRAWYCQLHWIFTINKHGSCKLHRMPNGLYKEHGKDISLVQSSDK